MSTAVIVPINSEAARSQTMSNPMRLGCRPDCTERRDRIVGSCPALQHSLQQVRMVAPTDSTVVIYGETGTGKELFAGLIHELSRRSSGPFIRLNCAAIPEGLLESELFGHEKGAFTSAIAQRVGRFEAANHGTLFLDEIGDIPFNLQAKLLRVLQEQEFERLGSARTIRTDVRVIAATNRDLSRLVEEKTFRMDLFYRLNVFPMTLPPLRGRREDIPGLVQHFIDAATQRMQRPIRTIPPEAMQALVDHSWPGNVRELQNCIERAVILSQDGVLRVPPFEPRRNFFGMPCSGTLEDVERDHILQVLDQTGWVIGGAAGAARRLGLKRTTLISKIKKLGLGGRRAARLSGDGRVSHPVSPNLPEIALPSYA